MHAAVLRGRRGAGTPARLHATGASFPGILLALPRRSRPPCSVAVKIKSWATHRVELPELAVPELAVVPGGHAKA